MFMSTPNPLSDMNTECGCGCGQLVVEAGIAVSDAHGDPREDRTTGELWLAECSFEAEMALRCP